MKRHGIIIAALGLFIFAQAALADWTPPKRLTWTAGDSNNPVLALDASDNLHFVWHDDTPGNFEIFYARSTDGGFTWTSGKRLTLTSGASKYPVIVVDSSNRLHIFWQDDTPGNGELYYKRSMDSGITWTSSRRLTWTSGTCEWPAAAVDSSGCIHVVWHDYSPASLEIYYRHSTDGGLNWSIIRRLTWNPGFSGCVAIACDSTGNPHLFWVDNAAGNDEIYYRKSADGGAVWTTNKRLTWTSGLTWYPSVAIDFASNLHIVFQDRTSGQHEIYYKNSGDGGATWTASKRLTWNSGASTWPVIAADSFGYLHVVWMDETPGNYEIYCRESEDWGATWSTSQRLSRTSGTSGLPCIVVDSNDNLHVVWHDNDSGNAEIYYKKYVK